MLVFSRKVNDRIVIAGGIEITLLRIHSCEARIGIDAPREIPIFRGELLDRIRKADPGWAVVSLATRPGAAYQAAHDPDARIRRFADELRRMPVHDPAKSRNSARLSGW